MKSFFAVALFAIVLAVASAQLYGHGGLRPAYGGLGSHAGYGSGLHGAYGGLNGAYAPAAYGGHSAYGSGLGYAPSALGYGGHRGAYGGLGGYGGRIYG